GPDGLGGVGLVLPGRLDAAAAVAGHQVRVGPRRPGAVHRRARWHVLEVHEAVALAVAGEQHPERRLRGAALLDRPRHPAIVRRPDDVAGTGRPAGGTAGRRAGPVPAAGYSGRISPSATSSGSAGVTQCSASAWSWSVASTYPWRMSR